MGDSNLKNRTRIGSAIDLKLYKEIKKLSTITQIPMSKLLDKAIELLLISYEDKRGTGL